MDKNQTTGTLDLQQKAGVAGIYSVRVMNGDGTPATPWRRSKNLILPGGYNATGLYSEQFTFFHAGSGSSPNKTTLDGTFEQTGTTVTRTSGTGVFVSGNVNDWIKFATGEYARISAFTNSLTVTVDRSQTVAPAALTVYDCSRTLLDTWEKSTSTKDETAGANGSSMNYDAGTTRYWRTCNFATETVAKTYTEFGVTAIGGTSTSTLFSRVLFESPVSVDIGQFLQVRFDLIVTLANYRTGAPITVNITGWPYPYAIQSIVSNGTYWDVLLDKACSSHYVAGRTITIAGALPATTAITSISSTPSDFTVNATAHGKNIGDSIVIAGATPAGYNGTWTVATVPNANSLTVTSAANLGAGSGGTVRLATPGTWYDGTHTIASFPTTSTIRITNANSIPAAGIAGTVTNSIAATGQITNNAVSNTTSSGRPGPADVCTASASLSNFYRQFSMIEEAFLRTGLTYGVNPSFSTAIVSQQAVTTISTYSVTERKSTFSWTIASANGNSQSIRQMFFCGSQAHGQLWVTFDERQRKDNGFQLVVNYSCSWEPDLN